MVIKLIYKKILLIFAQDHFLQGLLLDQCTTLYFVIQFNNLYHNSKPQYFLYMKNILSS
jgi:hypothetical protein